MGCSGEWQPECDRAQLTLDPDDQIWNQARVDLLEDVEAGDQFGAVLSVADFNGDGYSDLAVAAPFEDVDGVANAGAVHVVYGGPNGLQAESPDDMLLEFLQSTYEAAATLGRWDRQSLERPAVPPQR